MAAGLPTLPGADGAWLPVGLIERLFAPMLGDARNVAPALEVLGAPLVAAALARLGRPDPSLGGAALAGAVLNRATRRSAQALVDALAALGIAAVAVKGLATGAMLYPHPAYRPLPDVDLLVAEHDIARLGPWLARRGWTTRHEHLALRRWGALTRASFAPVAPPDGTPLVDFHRAIDDPPAVWALPAATILAEARAIDHEGGTLRVPAPEHVFVTLALHAFRDFYEPRALKGLVDAALLIERHGAALDWPAIERLAERGRFVCRLVLYRALLAEIGVATPDRTVAQSGVARWAAWLADNLRRLDWARLPDHVKARVEIAALDSARDVAANYGRRLAGLIRPRGHALPGVP
jgi:hypothetical protein